MKRINIGFNVEAFGVVGGWLSESQSRTTALGAVGLSTVASQVPAAPPMVDEEPNLMRPARLGLGAAYLPHSQAMAAADEKLKQEVDVMHFN